MKIYVVKTCDGDAYFQASRIRHKQSAMGMAVEQVLANDLSRYEEADVAPIREAWAEQNWPKLWQALVDCGAIREEYVRE
jgi:hypothetical protein